MPVADPPRVCAADARRLLMAGTGLLADPGRRATPAALRRTIESMGFVQVDTINVVERAHHHVLLTRLDGYRRETLARLQERDRCIFEHWTHDASIIPSVWYAFWRRRFRRYRERGLPNQWWKRRIGPEPDRVIGHVKRRIAREGPLMSKDFEHTADGRGDQWWGWKPQKAALEYLWRTGEISIARRVNFHKVYDLTRRVLPDLHDATMPRQREHRDWACREALDRLGTATPAELSQFLAAIGLEEARAWCAAKRRTGEIVEVLVESADGSAPRRCVAPADLDRRLRRLPEPPAGMRLLSPFDPVLRDRRRALRLFGFDYRFEAFVPAPKRRYGYYVLPVLEGDRLVGRVDPKLHRDRGTLEIKGVWWEPDGRPNRSRRAALGEAVERLARAVGAEHWTLPARLSATPSPRPRAARG